MAMPAMLANAPMWQKIVFGLIPLALIVGLGYYFLIMPDQTHVAELVAKKAPLEKEERDARALAANLARFRVEAQQLRARLDQMRERLPSEKEVPPLYRTVSDFAFRAGLAISVFQPREPQPRDYYMEVPITLSAEAGYHQFGEFFDRVARLPRIVNVTDLRLSSTNKPGATVRADMTLMTYMYRPEGAPPPKPPGRR